MHLFFQNKIRATTLQDAKRTSKGTDYSDRELHLYHEIRKNTLLRASPETTWFDQKRTPTRYGMNQDKLRKNPD